MNGIKTKNEKSKFVNFHQLNLLQMNSNEYYAKLFHLTSDKNGQKQPPIYNIY